jgi:hypothetical protein
MHWPSLTKLPSVRARCLTSDPLHGGQSGPQSSVARAVAVVHCAEIARASP